MPTLANAIELCECNRTSLVFVFISRFDYGIKTTVNRLLAVVEKSIDEKKASACSYSESDPNRALLMVLVGSETRRAQVLNALGDRRGFQKAYNLLWDAIGEGLQSRAVIMSTQKGT